MSLSKFGTYAALTATIALPMNSMATPTNATAPTLNATDQHIHDYIMNNPKVIIESLQAYQREMQKKEHDEKIAASIDVAAQMRNPSVNTIAGNPNGSVTLVEFFDYQCIMCYRVYQEIEKLIKKNNNLRVVFRLLPIFGKASAYAAKIDIAAAQQGKYAKFHSLMFKAKHLEGKLTNSQVDAVAKQAGVVVSKSVMKSISAGKGKAYLEENLKLARALKISGTPTFYVIPSKGKVTKQNLQFFGGVAPAQFIQKAIDRVAGKSHDDINKAKAAVIAKKK